MPLLRILDGIAWGSVTLDARLYTRGALGLGVPGNRTTVTSLLLRSGCSLPVLEMELAWRLAASGNPPRRTAEGRITKILLNLLNLRSSKFKGRV
jgi:hypothetical protein